MWGKCFFQTQRQENTRESMFMNKNNIENDKNKELNYCDNVITMQCNNNKVPNRMLSNDCTRGKKMNRNDKTPITRNYNHHCDAKSIDNN